MLKEGGSSFASDNDTMYTAEGLFRGGLLGFERIKLSCLDCFCDT